MTPYFFRVEHDLLRSDSFKMLGGSAIKVYLVIGLYSDFGSDWAYPSIRTIARQAGLSRQTVLASIEELTRCGLLATSKSKGRSTAYKIIRQPPARRGGKAPREAQGKQASGLKSLMGEASSGPISLEDPRETGPDPFRALAQFVGQAGPEGRPEQKPGPKEDSTSIPIPGTPFRLTAEGRLLVAVDLQELLTSQGLPRQLAERLAAQKAPEDVAKVLLNAFYLQSQGKLQNGPGYIRAGIEDGYDLLPQVANRLETRRRELEAQLQSLATRQLQSRAEDEHAAEEAAITLVLERLGRDELDALIQRAVASLPQPIVRRNPTLSNPFVRAKVYELACGDPLT